MHYREHNPPHFHALYAGQEVQIRIDSMQVMKGSLSQRAFRLVLEWAVLHKEELDENWRLREQRSPLKPIEALE